MVLTYISVSRTVCLDGAVVTWIQGLLSRVKSQAADRPLEQINSELKAVASYSSEQGGVS